MLARVADQDDRPERPAGRDARIRAIALDCHDPVSAGAKTLDKSRANRTEPADDGVAGEPGCPEG